jgi:fumarate hydratase subunit beta
MGKNGEKLPFNLKDGALWHCGPIARKVNDEWQIVSAGPTSSSRFNELGAILVKDLSVRVTIGKGTMGPVMINALKELGGVYLMATGGCAALYAQQVEKVENVHWLDLGMPEAVWVLQVNQLGPLVVGIDSKGNSLSQNVLKEVRSRIDSICKDENVDPNRTYVWWPKEIAGTKELMDTVKKA